MPDLGAYDKSVEFDWGVADALVAQLTARAALLRAQGDKRNPLAAKARTDWRGVYEAKFGERMKVCLTDAGDLAKAMEKAAKQVKELAKLAREEQERRNLAKQYVQDH